MKNQNVQEIDKLINKHHITNFNTRYYDKEVNKKINTLFNLLDNIKSMGDNDLKILYFSIKKTNKQKTYWYRLQTTKYKCYRVVNINYKTIINADISENTKSILKDEYIKLLNFIISKVKWCLKLLKENKYNSYIKNNLPYENRFGVIKRRDYWEIYPFLKRELLNKISFKQIKEFVTNDFTKPTNRIKEMTAQKYFECITKAYKAINYNTNIKKHFKYSDGKDNLLSKINQNSPKAFNNWYNNENIFGGHPFEIIRGSSSTRINLYIEKDNGYYLALNGRNILKNIEIAKIYLALKKEIPIYLYNHETIKKSFCGSDYLGIVPTHLNLVGCNIYFKNYEPLEFIYYNNDLLNYIKWQEIEKAYLKIK